MKKTLFILTIIITIILCAFIISGCGKQNSTKQNQSQSNFNQQTQSTQIVTPNVLSLNKDTAKESLEKLGFVVELQEDPKYDDTIADGNIVSQSLNEGTVVIKGAKIVLSYNSARFRVNYVEMGDFYNASITGNLPDALENITIDTAYNNKMIVGFYLTTDDSCSINTITIPNSCDSISVNAPNLTIKKIIIDNKEGTVFCMPIFCKNQPIIEYRR